MVKLNRAGIKGKTARSRKTYVTKGGRTIKLNQNLSQRIKG